LPRRGVLQNVCVFVCPGSVITKPPKGRPRPRMWSKRHRKKKIRLRWMEAVVKPLFAKPKANKPCQRQFNFCWCQLDDTGHNKTLSNIHKSGFTEMLNYFEFWRFHSVVLDNFGLLGCYTAWLGEWFATFRRIVLPSFSRFHWPKKNCQEELHNYPGLWNYFSRSKVHSRCQALDSYCKLLWLVSITWTAFSYNACLQLALCRCCKCWLLSAAHYAILCVTVNNICAPREMCG
jgi:hypothetical protein